MALRVTIALQKASARLQFSTKNDRDDVMAKDTKNRIARAALELFVQDGFDAATTRQIAARCGLSEGAIYRHYASKDDIARDLFLSIHTQLTRLVPEAATGAPNLEHAVKAIITNYCEVADNDWTLYSFHLLQLHRFLGYWKDEDGDPVSAVAMIIRNAIEQGDIPDGDPELLAGMALGVVTQIAQNKAYGRLNRPLSDFVPAFVVAIMAVLRSRAEGLAF
jgi:AcrR family transcriptional regulator